MQKRQSMTSACSVLCLLLSFIGFALCAEARDRIAALDPTAQLIEQLCEAGIPFSDPMLPMYAEGSCGDDFRLLYAPLPEALASPAEYRDACNDIALEGGTLREDSLRLVLTACMRHGDLELFQNALGLAGDNARYLLGEDDGSLYFVYEMMSPLTPAVFLEAFLGAAGPSSGLARLLVPRMSLLNPGHVEVLTRRCGALLKDLQTDGLIMEGEHREEAGPVDAFQRIVLNEDGPVAAGDSTFTRVSLPAHEVIYSTANANQLGLNLHAGLSTADIVHELMQAMRADAKLLLSAFIYDRGTNGGVMVKTAGHAGPLMLVLDFNGDECVPIPAMNEMMTMKPGGIVVVKFAITPGQFLLGFPGSLVDAFEMGLYSQSASWFMDPPSGVHEVRVSFRSLLENRMVLQRTEIIYAALKALSPSTVMPSSSSSFSQGLVEMQQGEPDDNARGKEPEEDEIAAVEMVVVVSEQYGGEASPFLSCYDFAFDSDSDEADVGHGKEEEEAEDADMMEGILGAEDASEEKAAAAAAAAAAAEEEEAENVFEAVQRTVCPERTVATAYAIVISATLLYLLIDSNWTMFLS